MGWSWTRFGIARKKRKSALPVSFFCVEWTRMRAEVCWPVKPEWRLLAGGRLCRLIQKDVRRKVVGRLAPEGSVLAAYLMSLLFFRQMLDKKQNVVLRCSPGRRPGGGVCGARSPACIFSGYPLRFVAGEIRHIEYIKK